MINPSAQLSEKTLDNLKASCDQAGRGEMVSAEETRERLELND